MSKKQSLNSNTFFNTLKSLFSVIYPIISFPYVSRVLGANNIGKINFGNSIVSYVTLAASLGITSYAVRECSKVRSDKYKLEKLTSEIYSINIVSTIFAYILLTIALVFVRELNDYRLLICVQSISVMFITLGADWINTTFEDFKYISIRTISAQLITLLLMFVFVKKPEDYIVYAIICVIASSGANVVNIFYRKRFCKMRFVTKMNIKNHYKPILLIFSMTLTQTIFCNSDMTMLGVMKGDMEVGLYATSVKIFTLVSALVSSNIWVTLPQISESIEKQEWEKASSFIEYSLNFLIILGLPAIAGLNVIPSSIIYMLAGPDYLEAVLSLRWITLALLCSFTGSWIGSLILMPLGKEKICLLSSSISALFNVVLNVFLIPKFGLNGAAFTTFLTEGLGVLIMLPHVDRRIKIKSFSKMIISPLVGCLYILAVGFLMSMIFSSHFTIAISTIILSCLGYIVILYIMKNEFFINFIRKKK